MDGWVDGWMDRWMDGWIDRQMLDGWMHRRMDGWMDRQMVGWMDAQTDGWVDGWLKVGDRCPGLSEVLLGATISAWWSPSGLRLWALTGPRGGLPASGLYWR